MQHQSRVRNKVLREGTYVIQLNNGEQHYVQATSATAASATLALHPSQFHEQNQSNYEQLHVYQPQQSPNVQHHTDALQQVIEFIQHFYIELSREKHFTHFNCLFCLNEYNDLRILLRHIVDAHQEKLLDSTFTLDADFLEAMRNKMLSKGQSATVSTAPASGNSQLYQCVQCQQMFSSMELISQHLNHCQPTPPSQPTQHIAYEIKSEENFLDEKPNLMQLSQSNEPYVPYGCARCGRRYHLIRDLTKHLLVCSDDALFYDASKHLLPEYWVEAPKNQHIVINEDSTNVTLKTTGLWLMPDPNGQTELSDSLRGFWVMPSSTADFAESTTVIPTISPTNLVSVAKAPSNTVISHQHQLHDTVPQQQMPSTQSHNQHLHQTDGISCIQNADGSYQVINSVNLNETSNHQMTNATTVIAHTPALDATTAARKKRTRTSKNTAYTHQTNQINASAVQTYTAMQPSLSPMTVISSPASAKRKRASNYTSTVVEEPPSVPASIVQNIEPEPQQYYLAYDQNGVLVPIENPSTYITNTSPDMNVVNLTQNQYIVQNLDEVSSGLATLTTSASTAPTAVANVATVTTATASVPVNVINADSSRNGLVKPLINYDIDDLSHLDKPIPEKPPAILKPLKAKPQFMDSFFTFLMNRETNKL